MPSSHVDSGRLVPHSHQRTAIQMYSRRHARCGLGERPDRLRREDEGLACQVRQRFERQHQTQSLGPVDISETVAAADVDHRILTSQFSPVTRPALDPFPRQRHDADIVAVDIRLPCIGIVGDGDRDRPVQPDGDVPQDGDLRHAERADPQIMRACRMHQQQNAQRAGHLRKPRRNIPRKLRSVFSKPSCRDKVARCSPR